MYPMDPLTQPVSSLKPKLRRLSANLGVSVSRHRFQPVGHQTGWEMLGNHQSIAGGFPRLMTTRGYPEGTWRESNGECWCLPLIQWILPLNGEFCPGPSSVFLRILQIFPSTNSMNHSKWSQVVSSADMFFSDKCRSQRDFHRVDLVFTILNWLSKLLLKGIVSPLHHHYIHPQDHHCIPDTSRYFQLPSFTI